jgi:predicted RNase H-like nuclease (RuvC/YqgF family)
MLVTLGIDPGKDGAVAILRDGELVHLLDVGDPELLDTMRLLSNIARLVTLFSAMPRGLLRRR